MHKNTYMVHFNGSQSAGLDKLKSGISQQVAHDAIASKLAERFKTLGEKPSMIMQHHRVPVRPDEEVNSPSKFGGQVSVSVSKFHVLHLKDIFLIVLKYFKSINLNEEL